MGKREIYPSDLSDKEWNAVRRHLPGRGKLGRPPRYERREILNAIIYLTRQGGSWRGLPHDLPPWRLVYYYFEKWAKEGVWKRINDALREKVREKSGKKKPRAWRSSTARALKWLGSEESAALMQERRSWDGKDTCW